MFKLKRIYEKYDKADGYRVLVDRLWPRGVKKSEAKIDLWMKEIAPSTELRQWFAHDPAKWNEFKNRYKKEVKLNVDLLNSLKSLNKKYKIVTLLYAAKDEEHNEAVVLKEILK